MDFCCITDIKNCIGRINRFPSQLSLAQLADLNGHLEQAFQKVSQITHQEDALPKRRSQMYPPMTTNMFANLGTQSDYCVKNTYSNKLPAIQGSFGLTSSYSLSKSQVEIRKSILACFLIHVSMYIA